MKKKIYLNALFVLLETTKQQLSNVVQLNSAMMYSMVGVASLALVTGNAIVFFILLDLLQSEIFFCNTYTMNSLQPILNYLKVDQLLKELNGKQLIARLRDHFQRAIQCKKLLFYCPCLYFNLFTLLLQFKYFRKFYIKMAQKYPVITKVMKFILRFKKYVQKKFKNQKLIFSLGIFQDYQAILLQLTFSVLLQYPNYRLILYLKFSTLSILYRFRVHFNIKLSIIFNYHNKYKNYKILRYFYSESKTEFLKGQFKSLQIFILYFQYYRINQLSSIIINPTSMQSFFFLMYLIRIKPLKSLFEPTKLVGLFYFIALNSVKNFYSNWLDSCYSVFCYYKIQFIYRNTLINQSKSMRLTYQKNKKKKVSWDLNRNCVICKDFHQKSMINKYKMRCNSNSVSLNQNSLECNYFVSFNYYPNYFFEFQWELFKIQENFQFFSLFIINYCFDEDNVVDLVIN
ncbi:unnamed protein product [Paramecium octaurelia]|uniref:Transmembrane protein n=1 Tax=Paramecium octaurelia TaxID=43137 RepID=A0A8S1TZJ6_PAROT|nr:unnamed protein product [Paramecium octaurelia]